MLPFILLTAAALQPATAELPPLPSVFEAEEGQKSPIPGLHAKLKAYDNTITFKLDGGQKKSFLIAEEGEGVLNWVFDKTEIDHLTTPLSDEPRQIINDFSRQMHLQNIKVAIVPVPTKTEIYYTKLLGDTEAYGRIDTHLTAMFMQARPGQPTYYTFIDLSPAFLRYRHHYDLYCHTDTHWSPLGVVVAANQITHRLNIKLDNDPKINGTPYEYDAWVNNGLILGDLGSYLDYSPEMIQRVTIGKRLPGDIYAYVAPDPKSKILVMGSDWTTIYHEGEFGQGGGIPDHIGRFAQQPVSLLKGDINSVRRQLAANPELLENKKYIIWVFSVLDLQGQKWSQVNIRQPATAPNN